MNGEQHVIRLTIDAVYLGSAEDAFAEAIADGTRLADECGFDGAHILVTATDRSLLGTSSGVYCEGCDGHPIEGVRWPTIIGSDDSREWVERCDTCKRFPSDEAAAEAVVAFYAGTGTHERVGMAEAYGLPGLRPYVAETEAVSA